MSNTEINSLFEIAINLENKGLYAQADKARNIIVRLSADASSGVEAPEFVKTIAYDFLEQLKGQVGFLAAFGIANFIPVVKDYIPKLMKVLPYAAWADLVSQLYEISKLSSKFNWQKFVSGEDTSAAEIADRILAIFADFCMIFGKVVPAFNYWVYIFAGIRSTLNVKTAKQLGYYVGGMPGGEAQMKQIENFDVTTAVNDPYARQVLHSILVDLGLDGNEAESLKNVSKLPKTLGGLDFFTPYINKFDTKKIFKDLTSTQPSASTMEFKKGLVKIMTLIRALKGLKGK
jgi:hypothetical protein